MFGRMLAAITLVLLICFVAPAAESFPYSAMVLGKGTSIRSGPSNEHYATDFLAEQEVVEVYKHDGPWAAIRPPEGSFSWVLASQVAIDDDPRVGKARVPNVSCRVGTRYSDSHGVEFVRLTLGEPVVILGRDELAEEDTSRQVWYKISPPAGEFRWVRRDALTTEIVAAPTASEPSPGQSEINATPEVESGASEGTQLQTEPITVDDSPAETQVVDASSAEETSEHLSPRLAGVANESPATWTVVDEAERNQTGRPERVTEAVGEGQVALAQSIATAEDPLSTLPPLLPSAEEGENSSNEAMSPATTPPPTPAATDTSALSSSLLTAGNIRPELLRHELLGVEWKLTEVVVQPPAAWELAALRTRTQTIIDLSPNAEIRADAHRMLAKIAQFEDLQRRHLQLASAESAGATASRPQSIANLLGGTVTAAGLSAEAGTRGDYAGTGWLMPLVTRREGLPRYALTDQDGNIMQFITPAPGMNLNPYTRKRIGVYGQRGFIPDLNKPHLMAERVISLDRVK